MAGGSGAASADVVSLSTAITAAPQAPSSLDVSAGAILQLEGDKIATFIAQDLDTPRRNLRFSLTTGFDADLVNLDAESGVLTLKSDVNQDALAQVRDRGYLELNVAVSDGEQRLSEVIRIAAENQTNKAPTVDLNQEAGVRPTWAPLDDPNNIPYQVYLPAIEKGAVNPGASISTLFDDPDNSRFMILALMRINLENLQVLRLCLMDS